MLSAVGKVLSPPRYRDERGMTLIEILIALAIMSLAGVTFLAGLTTAFQGIMVSDRSVTKEGLAKSQMEYIKSQPYIDDLSSSYEKLTAIPSHYSIEILAEVMNQDGDPDDDGLQQITVTVSHVNTVGEVTSLTVSGYKLRRP